MSGTVQPVDEVTFVGPGGHRAVLTQLVDGPLDRVALLVSLGVEGGRPTAPGPTRLTPGDLVRWLRDRGADAPAAQHRADLGRGVGLVGQHPVGTGARASTPRTFDADSFEDGAGGQGVVALPGGGHPGQGPTAGVGGDVDLRAQPVTGTAQVLPVLVDGLGPDIVVIRLCPLCQQRAWRRPPAAWVRAVRPARPWAVRGARRRRDGAHG